MSPTVLPMNDAESRRLQALASYAVLDTAPEEAFDRLTRLAADLFDTPMALVSLVAADRQWFKSRIGVDDDETPRSVSFCAHAIQQDPRTTMVVEDATKDARFADNPMVTGDANVRFYAGAVLTDKDGHNLGSLCVVDTKPRPTPNPKELARLQILADIVVDELALRRASRVAAAKSRQLDMAERMSGVGRWLYLMSGRIYWSDELYRIHGVDRGAYEPKIDTALDFFSEEDRPRVKALVDRAVAKGEGYDFEADIDTPDGRRRVKCKAECLINDQGAVFGVTGVFQDVTEQRDAQAKIAESERRFRSLAVNAPDIISESRLDGQLTYVSPACLAITGFTPEELIGGAFHAMMNPEDAAKIQEMCSTVFASKGKIAPWPVEFRAYHKDGHELWFECKPTLTVDPATGRYIGLTDVLRDITQRKALEAALHHARAEAEAATAVKSEFLANMSHELRTPLTSIIGFTGLAADQPDLPDLARNYVGRVRDASRALLCTVNDILDFSKLEAGQVAIHAQPTSVAELARSTLDLFTPQAGAKDLALVLTCPEDLVLAVDPDRVRQVLLNLVGNAVKFTDAGGVMLKVDYDTLAGELSVEVLDSGPGVPLEKQERLFKRFSQVDGSLTRSHGGTGLGLAICKGLVEAMGGEIGADSVVGEGSRFWFAIPAEPAVLAALAEGAPGADLHAFGGVRVLVVDDHLGNREFARLFLAGVGAEVTEAEDGEIAAEIAAAWPFDVILMDMRMPRLSGPEALRRIRGTAGPNDSTPILAFTADADGGDNTDKLAAMGFQGMVAKPLEAAALLDAVARAIAPVTTPLFEKADVA